MKVPHVEVLAKQSGLESCGGYSNIAAEALTVPENFACPRFFLEAVRTGFKRAWQERDYATIIGVARKIPDKILQEDPKLLMWYDQALTRTGEE